MRLLGAIICAGAAAMTAPGESADLQGRVVRPDSIGFKHMTYKVATGERVPGAAERNGRMSGTLWSAHIYDSFAGLGSCTHTPPEANELILDWGDLPTGSLIDGVEIAYATDAPHNPNAVTLEWMYLNNSNGFDNNDFNAIAAGFVAGLPGVPPDWPYSFVGWIITLDLEGSGFEFCLGDQDIDGDGLADFAYTYAVRDATGASATGPLAVWPEYADAPGAEDAFDLYVQSPGNPCADPNAPYEYGATYWFSWPYAQVYLVLYGVAGVCPAPSDCPEDIDGSGDIGLGDLSMMLSSYGLCVGQPGYNPAAEVTGDGCIGLDDLSQLLNAFGLTCPTR